MKHQLLLLHGALGAASQFQELSSLLQNDFELFTLDFEGHGNAPIKNRSFRIQHFTENVWKFLDQNRIASIHIFGYSMGGHVGLTLAADQPDRVKSVFTLATKFHWDEAAAQRESKLLNAEKMQEKVPHFVKQLQQRHGEKWRMLLEKSAAQMISMPQSNPLSDDALKKIQCPVRVSVGDRDTMVTLEETIHVYKTIPSCQLQIFPATPHPFEKISIALLSDAIRQFFK